MNNTKKRSFTALLCVLVCTLVLALTLGILSACGGDESANVNENANEATWYYGDAEPAEGLGKEGDYYLNTETLASYVKEGKTWRAAADGEAGNWFTGDTAPTDEIGEVNDFYLDTDSGKLYHKSEGGWGSPVLILKGENGRDGVKWFSGKNPDPNTYAEGDTTVKDAVKGDFYLDTENFEVWQKNAEGKWDDLGSLKGKDGEAGVSPKLDGFLTGTGAPTPDLGNDKDFYLDTESGEIYQKNGTWSSTGSLGTLSASQIKEIHLYSRSYGKRNYGQWSIRNSLQEMGGSWEDSLADQNTFGYWILFEDGSSLFIEKYCRHGQLTTLAYLYNNDCEYGTISIEKCGYCGEVYLKSAPASTFTPNHKYSSEWSSDETSHWHAPICSHKDDLGRKDEAGHVWREYYTTDYVDGSVKGYIQWKECKVCGYIESDKIITAESLLEGDVVHISNADEWNAFAKAVNNGETYGEEGKTFAEATVELDESIDFGGLKITPIGLPSNAAEVTDRTNGVYLDLKDGAVIEGGFKGTFHGNGNKLSNFKIEGGNFTGLFGYVDGATITDFTIENAKITGDAFVGAVAGFITGESVRISKVTVDSFRLIGYAHVGGIAGYAKDAGSKLRRANASDEAAIKNCTVQGTFTSTNAVGAPLDCSTKIYAAINKEHDEKDEYYDGANAGGILGTSHSSSVNQCYVTNIFMYCAGTASRVVGLADGTSEACSVIVGNVTGQTEVHIGSSARMQSSIVIHLSSYYKNSANEEGIETVGSGITVKAKLDRKVHGEDSNANYAEYADKTNVKFGSNKMGDAAPYTISTLNAVALPKRDDH